MIPTLSRSSARDAARRARREGTAGPTCVVGNNVLAHVPDSTTSSPGSPIVLGRDGVITMEFPHLLRLIERNQFDTIYHEHFSYFSLLTASRIFAAHGLTVFDVEELPTHGGSLRIYARHADARRPVEPRGAPSCSTRGAAAGLDRPRRPTPASTSRSRRRSASLLEFLIDRDERGEAVVGYGAPGKGNTLLNYCGIRDGLLDYTVDRNPHKQGKFLPGTHIPIYPPERIARDPAGLSS